MQSCDAFVALNAYVNLTVDHAVYGKLGDWSGRHVLPWNRLYLVPETPVSSRGQLTTFVPDGAGESIDLRPGDIVLVPAGVDTAYRFREGFSFIAFHFRLELLAGFDLFSERTCCEQIADAGADIQDVWAVLEDAGTLAGTLQVKARILSLLTMFLDGSVKEFQRSLALRQKYRELFALLEQPPDARVTIGELATSIGVSRSALSKGFIRDFGVPLKAHLNHRLCHEATRQIRLTAVPMGDIARRLGFSGVHYFSRFVKQHTGLSPRAIRQQDGPFWRTAPPP